MAWIYFQESVESRSPSNRGLFQSPIVKKSGSLKRSYFQKCKRNNSQLPRSGMMCKRSKGKISPKLKSCTAGFPAKISALRVLVAVWKESEAVFFSRSFGFVKKSNRNSFSWKTSQRSDRGEPKQSAKNWPKSGMIVGGRLFPLPNSELHTKGKGGFYLPTPTASDAGVGEVVGAKNRFFKTNSGNIRKLSPSGGDFCLKLPIWVLFFPTPTAGDTGHRLRTYAQGGSALSYRVGGKLNPEWVEWLMGYPKGWTELRGLGMRWCRYKLEKPSSV